MKKIIVIIAMSIPALAAAQSVPQSGGESYVKKGAFSLFDPSKLSMHQSYSFGYYSGGGTSGSLGYYLNSIEYRFSNPLRIRIDLGYLHSPTSMFSRGSSGTNSGVFVPGVSIDWRPARSFNFRFDYRSVPIGYYNGFGLNPYLQEDYR